MELASVADQSRTHCFAQSFDHSLVSEKKYDIGTKGLEPRQLRRQLQQWRRIRLPRSASRVRQNAGPGPVDCCCLVTQL